MAASRQRRQSIASRRRLCRRRALKSRRLSSRGTGLVRLGGVVKHNAGQARPVKRIKLFRQGELGRMILDALRDAPGELATAEIVSAILVAGGHGESARRALAPRVRTNLAYLVRRRMVVKSRNGRTARWALA